jgi:hypothetical protein
MKKAQKVEYTTYLLPSHLAALEEIAKFSGQSIERLIADSLDMYLVHMSILLSTISGVESLRDNNGGDRRARP